MDWIFSTHLEQLATFPPSVGMLGLMVWTKSGGAPHQEEPTRYPVTIGSARDAAAALGLSRSTVARHWPAFKRAFVEVDPGRFYPSITEWKEPTDGPTDSKGRGLYVRLTSEAVTGLSTLGKCANGGAAWSAFRLGVAMLPRLRAASARGRNSIVWTNDQIAARLGMGRTAITKALSLLERRGLIVTKIGRYRRISTVAGILNTIPKVRRAGSAQRFAQPVDNSIAVSQNGTAACVKTGPILKENKIHSKDKHRPLRGGDDCSRELSVLVFQERFPQIQSRAAIELASYCPTPDKARRWLAAESAALDTADNPPGMLLYLARSKQSAPGLRSTWATRLAKDDEKRAARRQSAGLDLPAETPETLRRISKIAIGNRQAAQNASEERARLRARQSAPIVEAAPRPGDKMTDTGTAQNRLAAMMARIPE